MGPGEQGRAARAKDETGFFRTLLALLPSSLPGDRTNATAEDAETLAGFLRGDAAAVRVVDTWVLCAAAPFRRRLFAEWLDLLQDVRIELLGLLRAGRWRGEARLKTYIWRVTAHTCIDATRRQRRRPVHEPVEPETPVASTDPSPYDRMVEESRQRLLLEALDAVPPDCRDLWRRILNGLSYLEISRDTGVAEGALRVRAHRCRKKALEVLAGRAGEGGVPAGNTATAADAK